MKRISKILILIIIVISFTSTVKADSNLSFGITAPSEVNIGDKFSIFISIDSFNNAKGDIKTCSFKITATNELTNQERVSAINNWLITNADVSNITISTEDSPVSSLSEKTNLVEIKANITDTTQITISNITCYGDSNKDDPYTAEDVSTTVSKKEYNASLQELSTSPVNISPSYTQDNLSYNVELGENQNTLTINANPVDSNATVKIMMNDEEVGKDLTITAKETIVYIIVNNGSATKTYTLNVVKASGNEEPVDTISTDLSKLEVGGKTVELKSGTKDYQVNVENSVSSVNIYAELKDSNAKFKENYGSREVQLNVGNNVFELIVLGDEDKETTYKITITRSAPASSSKPFISSSSSSPIQGSNSNPNTAGPLSITFIILFMVISLYTSIIYYKKYSRM